MLYEKITSPEKLESVYPGYGDQVRKYMGYGRPWWHVREEIRLRLGPYRTQELHALRERHYLPISEAPVYLHQSEIDKSLVVFTPNEKYGRQDRKIHCRLGSYLKKYYGQELDEPLTSPQIALMVNTWTNLLKPQNLKFANDPDQCEWVYVNGPNSCMNNKSFNVHPVRVYGGPDTSVAYLIDHCDADHVIARSVVNIHKKTYSQCYGNTQILRELLQKAEYRYDENSLTNCRLLLIRDSNSIVCPYLDNKIQRAVVGSEFLIVNDSDESCEATSEHGLLRYNDDDDDEEIEIDW